MREYKLRHPDQALQRKPSLPDKPNFQIGSTGPHNRDLLNFRPIAFPFPHTSLPKTKLFMPYLNYGFMFSQNLHKLKQGDSNQSKSHDLLPSSCFCGINHSPRQNQFRSHNNCHARHEKKRKVTEQQNISRRVRLHIYRICQIRYFCPNER